MLTGAGEEEKKELTSDAIAHAHTRLRNVLN